MENGPCWTNADGSGVVYNQYSWTQNASVIWLDQPAGAGFSTGDTDTTALQTAEDIWVFLQELYAVHPEWLQNDVRSNCSQPLNPLERAYSIRRHARSLLPLRHRRCCSSSSSASRTAGTTCPRRRPPSCATTPT